MIENLAVNYDTPTIIGTIIANGDYYSVADTYIKVVDESTNETVWNNKPAADGDFAVSALDASKTYTMYFSSNRLSDVNITRSKALSSDFSGTFGAIRTGVSPLSGKSKDVGDIILTPNGKITGSVELSDGSTPEGVDVFLNNTSYATKTASDGSYTLSDVVQGTYTLVFSMDGYSTVSKNTIVYSSDLTTNPSVTEGKVKLVVETSNISGTVSYSDKTDSTGINVLLINSDGVTVKTLNTNSSSGTFSFTSIKPGTYTIRAKADGYVSIDKSITVTEGESYVLPLGSLVNLCGIISGKVTTSDSATGSDTKVTAVHEDGKHSYEVTTSSTGEYIISNAFNGKYTITFAKNEYITATNEVTLESGGSATSNVELKSKYGFITVNVGYSDNTNPEGIIVSVYKGTTLISASKTTNTGVLTITKLEQGDDYKVVASCEGYSSVEVNNIAVAICVGTELSLGKLSNRYGAISGVVVNQDNTPIENAVVSLTRNDGAEYTVFTDSNGAFSKTDVVGTYSIIVTKEGFMPTTLESKYTVESKKETKINDSIVLYTKFATINGSVKYGDVADASNISVTIENSVGIISSVTTSSEGLFNFTVEAGTYTIRANATGYEESVKEISVVANTTYAPKLESLISRYGIISGKVTDSNSNPVEGATVLINGDNGSSYSKITLSDGSFSEKVLVGSYSVSISKVDYKTTTLTLKYTVLSSKTTSVEDIALTSQFSLINGKVSLIDGSTPEGISVVISDSNGTAIDTTTTGTDGTFAFRVGEGTYSVKASKDGYTSTSKEITIVSGKSYSLDIGSLTYAYGTLKGKLVDSSGSVITGAVITVTNMDGSVSPYTLSTNESGEFSSSTILIGTYSLLITKSGYVDIALNSIPIVGGSTYDIGTKTMIVGSAGINGRVILEGVSNYSGVTVTATSTSDFSKVYTTTSDEDGSYYFLSLDSGIYSIKLQKEGFISDASQQVSLENGKISSVKTITLKNESSTISGTVALTGGTDYTAIQVLVMNSATSTTFNTTTDRNGKYVVKNLTAGTYELIFSKGGYGSVTVKDVQIGKGEEKILDNVILEVAYTSVKGNITLEEASDYSGTLVTATNISNTELIYSAITNSDGNFTLAKMYAGEYSIVVSRSNYLSATLPTVTVVDDTPIDCGTTELVIAKGEITGLVKLEGYSDYSGVKVSLVGTGKETTTAKDGSYTFTVPAGNYSGGIRYEYEDFETTSYATNIAVLPTTSYSSAYVVPDVEMKCLRVPKVSGKVTVYGLTKEQYQDITITIAELPAFTYTTGEDGTYYFEHVPVGTYTLEYTRENARKVTKIVAVEASPEIKIENIELIPDAITLYGNISLNGVKDYSGVTVRVTTPDSVELKTVTNAAGCWYISNIVASKSHTITFEKDGWESQTFNIGADEYEPLSMIDYSSAHPVVLQDTVAPVITALTATVGKSTEAGREIYLYLYTQEEGSGIKYIQGNTADTFESVAEQEYYNPFKLIIPDELGAKTIYVRVKDAAGNISNVISTNVVLKNDKTELYQTLSGDKLHLTKANSPYVMTDNILVPEGSTLIIDAGVEIQVNGEYYIQVEGTLQSNGTADDKVKIYGLDDGANWVGIKIINDNESKISYTEITGMTQGIQGYGSIENSTLTAASDGYVLGHYLDIWSDYKCFYGTIVNSKLSGNVCAEPHLIKCSEVKADKISLTLEGEVFDSQFSGALNGSMSGTFIQNTIIGTGELKISNSYLMNNQIQVSNLSIEYSNVKYTTISNSALSLIGGVWSKDELNNCSFSSYSVNKFTQSNLISCGIITITSQRINIGSYDMTNNHWGEDKTVELNQKTADDIVSFLYHYTNDFNLSTILWNNYSNTSFTDCGYQGKNFRASGSYSGYSIGDTGPAGGIVFYDKGYYSDGWRYLEVVANDIKEDIAFGFYRTSGSSSNIEVGTGLAIGTGKANTEALVEMMGDIAYISSSNSNTTQGLYAAKGCDDYSITNDGVVYDDWFLPSVNEIKLMYVNLYLKNLRYFCATSYEFLYCYWSSSEGNGSAANAVNFRNYFSSFLNSRDNSLRLIIPIRAF